MANAGLVADLIAEAVPDLTTDMISDLRCLVLQGQGICNKAFSNERLIAIGDRCRAANVTLQLTLDRETNHNP